MSDTQKLADALSDVLRMLEAVRYTAGLGKNQILRMEKAKAVLAAHRAGGRSS